MTDAEDKNQQIQPVIGLVGNQQRHPKTLIVAMALTLCLVTALIVSAAYIARVSRESKARINKAEIIALLDNNNCKKGLEKTSKQKVEPKHADDSIALLNYRSYCLVATASYPEALNNLTQLKRLYLAKHDFRHVDLVEKNMQAVKYDIANPVPPYSSPPSEQDRAIIQNIER